MIVNTLTALRSVPSFISRSDLSHYSVVMCRLQRKVLRDPLMLSLTFFTFLFIIIVAMASAEPWRIPSKHRKTRDLSEMSGDRNYDCLYTYTAYQPNMDFFKEKVVEMTVDRCKDIKGDNKKRRRNLRGKGKKAIKTRGHVRKKETLKKPGNGGKNVRKKSRKNRKNKKNGGKHQRGKRNRKKTKSSKMPRRKKIKKNKKVYRDLEQFQNWKRMMSQRRLMAEPVAKEAVASLWSGLMEKGGEWREVFDEMHHLEDHGS